MQDRFLARIALLALISLPHAVPAAASENSHQGRTSLRVQAEAPKGIRESFYSCIDQQGQNLASIASCITEERNYQDARLNKTYKQLLQLLGPDAKTSLIAAEKAWIASKDEDEKFEATIYGGDTLDDVSQEQNATFRLCQRANILEKYLGLAKLNK